MMMFGAMLLLVPMSLMNGMVAFLLWGYTTVLSPALYLYGFMQGFRYNFLFAFISLALLAANRVPNRGKFTMTRTNVLLVIYLVHAMLVALLAITPNPLNGIRIEGILKALAFVLVMPLFITSRLRLHVTILVLVLGLGMHGTVEGLKFVASGGGHNVTGIPTSSLSDNNLFALGMVMLLPLILYIYQYSDYKWVRLGAIGAFGLTILTVLGTNSRGGFLSLAVVGLWYVLTSRRKFFSMAMVAVAAAGVLAVAPARWFERMDTINTAGQDSSFMGRVAMWQINSAIAIGNPVFGGGFHAGQIPTIAERYKKSPSLISVNDIDSYPILAAHSVYFQLMGDTGFVGLFIYMSLMASGYISRSEIKKLVKKNPEKLAWARDLADALTLSLIAFMVGGAGVSLPYFELIFIVVNLLAITKTVAENTLEIKPKS